MKTAWFTLFFVCLQLTCFSQQKTPNLYSTNRSNQYYLLYDDCDDNSTQIGCYEFGIEWVDQNDPSAVFSSDITFYYFPDPSKGCTTSVKYILSAKNGWIYNDENVRIVIKLEEVETFFGYSVSEIQVVSKKSNYCLSPVSFSKKL